jgi:hypothetical protein
MKPVTMVAGTTSDTRKKPLCREVPDLEGIIKMSKQEVAHELRRMQSRMLNLDS